MHTKIPSLLFALSLMALSSLPVFSQTTDSKNETPLTLDTHPVLFVDNWFIEEMKNTTLRMHSPVRKEVVFVFDAPWEGAESGYVTLLKDGASYRMYYRGGGESTREYTCLAESSDGINWKRPKLGLIEFEGSKENNIVWTGENPAYCESHNFTPFIDLNPAAKPEERYKAVALRVLPDEKGKRRKMLVGLVSPEGINWKRISDNPIISDGSFDSQNTCFWDSARGYYVCFFRVSVQGKRSISRAISDDFRSWEVMGQLDFGDTPPEHLYTNAILPYLRSPLLLLGFPMRFVPERRTIGLDNRSIDGVSDAIIMSSHDGKKWYRPFMEAYIRPGLNPANWGHAHGNNTPAWGLLPLSQNEISIYWMENYGTLPHLRRGTVRLDGFISINAPYEGGEFMTKPFVLKGIRLVINYSTSAVGSVKVEILDKAGKIVPGYSLTDCNEIYGDEIERIVSWKKGADLKTLKNKTIRLRIVMKDADLYSMRMIK